MIHRRHVKVDEVIVVISVKSVPHEPSRTFVSKVLKAMVQAGSTGNPSAASLPGRGVSPQNSFSFFCAPPQAAREERKKVLGTPGVRRPANPGLGRLPFAIPLPRRVEKGKTSVLKIRDDS